MKKLLWIALIFAFFAAKPLFVNKYYNRSVVILYAEYEGSLHGECSATAFEKTSDGYLFLTASHCVNDPEILDFKVGDDNPTGKRYQVQSITYGDELKQDDFAVLSVKASAGTFKVVHLGRSPWFKGEPIFSINAPHMVGKSYVEGVVSLPDIPSDQTEQDSGDWTHNVLFQMEGEGPGASGGSLMCEDQFEICGVIIGHVSGGMVAEPIGRFKQWWYEARQTPPINLPKPSSPSEDSDDQE